MRFSRNTRLVATPRMRERVVCTFGGAPDGWVTSELIKDGEVTPADLAFSPATPAYSHDSTSVDQTVTTTPTTYQSVSQTVTVPSGGTASDVVDELLAGRRGDPRPCPALAV